MNAFQIIYRAAIEHGKIEWLKNPYRIQYTLKPTGDYDQLLADELFEKLKDFAEFKGGIYTFTVQPEAFGYMKVKDFCKAHGMTRQWLYQTSHKYEWIVMSKNIRFCKSAT